MYNKSIRTEKVIKRYTLQFTISPLLHDELAATRKRADLENISDVHRIDSYALGFFSLPYAKQQEKLCYAVTNGI